MEECHHGKKITYVYCRIGLNHNGSIDLVKKHIESPKKVMQQLQNFRLTSQKRDKPNSPIFEILKQCELSIVISLKEF